MGWVLGGTGGTGKGEEGSEVRIVEVGIGAVIAAGKGEWDCGEAWLGEEWLSVDEKGEGRGLLGKGKGKDKGVFVGEAVFDSVGKGLIWGVWGHVCKEVRVVIHVLDEMVCVSDECSASVECVRPGKMVSLNKTCLEV